VCSSDLLEQLVVNLADNAARAARGVPHRRPRIRITVEKDAAHARLSVEDSGPGVPAQDRERIFDPFYTTAVDGTGIGLSIVQRILADHGGAVQVTDSPLGGAAFLVELPTSSPRTPIPPHGCPPCTSVS
jgi:signal transduction histidine kinase